MRDKILEIVCEAVEFLNRSLTPKLKIENKESCTLYGGDGMLDSLSLVSLIVWIEEQIECRLGISLILADEKAMSQKRSPFASVSTLTDYIDSLISSGATYE